MPTPFDLVAASFLRSPTDTKLCVAVARRFASGDTCAGRDWLVTLAGDLGVTPGERQGRIEGAQRMAEAAVRRGTAAALELVTMADPGYPAWLRTIPDPPLALWTQGAPLDRYDATPIVGMVGSRQATPAGLATARRLGRDLAAAGVVVVSGLARGIDGAAHHGALDGGGQTIAVLGCGVDVVYPREHRALSAAITAAGALVSELPPGTPPLAPHFPLRNRIISGLSRAVVVVEASEKSGSLITARNALEQGRDVLAVPGSIASGCYRGCHGLIKDGARLVETVDDVLDEIGWRPSRPSSDNGRQVNELDAILRRGEAAGLEELVCRTGRPVEELLAALGREEVAGRVGRVAGGAFVRLD